MFIHSLTVSAWHEGEAIILRKHASFVILSEAKDLLFLAFGV